MKPNNIAFLFDFPGFFEIRQLYIFFAFDYIPFTCIYIYIFRGYIEYVIASSIQFSVTTDHPIHKKRITFHFLLKFSKFISNKIIKNKNNITINFESIIIIFGTK